MCYFQISYDLKNLDKVPFVVNMVISLQAVLDLEKNYKGNLTDVE